jgi:hypothetical protein
MKLKFYLILILSLGLIAGTHISAQPVVKLRNLEPAPNGTYRIVPDANGIAAWVVDATGELVVNLTPIVYVPTPSGNGSNLNQAVTDPNGDIWIIDSTGNAVKIGNTTSFSGSWNNLSDIPAGFADGIDNTTDSDSDATNEIQNSSGVALSTNLVFNGSIVSTVQEALEALAVLKEKQGLQISGTVLSITDGQGSIVNSVGLPTTTGGSSLIDSTRLTQDSILLYYQDGVEVGRDTIAGVSGGGGSSLVDSTRLIDNSIVVYYQDGAEVGRDTVRNVTVQPVTYITDSGQLNLSPGSSVNLNGLNGVYTTGTGNTIVIDAAGAQAAAKDTITFTADAGPAQELTNGDFLDIEGDASRGVATVASTGKVQIRIDTNLIATRLWVDAQTDPDSIDVVPTGNLTSDNLQSALNEIQTEVDGLSSGTVPDGDKGDITVSGSGTVWDINNTAVAAGSYTNANITVAADGRVTSASSGAAGGGSKNYAEGDMTGSDLSGNTRGALSFDFQQGRESDFAIIEGVNNFGTGWNNWICNQTSDAFISGRGNVVKYDTIGFEHSNQGFVAGGAGNKVLGWHGFVTGKGSIAGGKISGALGTGCVSNAHDSYTLGNRALTGSRRLFIVEGSHGKDANHGLVGDLNEYYYFTLVDSLNPRISYGNLRGHFPYKALYTEAATQAEVQDSINAIYSIYGVPANRYLMDSLGYVMDSTRTPYPIGNSDGQNWAMAPYFYIKNTISETGLDMVKCMKTIHTPQGTKVYYDIIPDPDDATDLLNSISKDSLWNYKLNGSFVVYGSYSSEVLSGGNGQVALGRLTTSAGWGNLAAGEGSEAYGSRGAIALGSNARAWGNVSVALGYETFANELASMAVNFQTIASAPYSFAANNTTIASGNNSFSTGLGSTSSGSSSFAGGTSSEASGDGSTALGGSTIASGGGAFTHGLRSLASAPNSFCIGADSEATGDQSFSSGNLNESSGTNSFSTGSGNTASGGNSFVNGKDNIASGTNASATGLETLSSGLASVADGFSTEAIANYSYAGGNNTRAIATGARTTGIDSEASGLYSEAGGYGGVAIRNGERVWGAYSQQFPTQTIQDHRYITGDSTNAVGVYFKGLISKIEPHTTYSGKCLITGRQNSGANGEPGESIFYETTFLWSTEGQYNYTPSNINVDTDKIYFENAPDSGKVVIFSIATGGLLTTRKYYIISSVADSIQVSTAPGGSLKDITGTATGKMTVVNHDVNDCTVTLLGSSFEDDGDTVGNHTTTGIRVVWDNNSFWSDNIDNFFMIWLYGLSNRNIYWSYDTNWIQLKSFNN